MDKAEFPDASDATYLVTTYDFTATAIGYDDQTTDETISGSGVSTTLHQVVSGDSTLTNTGNEYSGNFSTTEYQNNATTLSQSGFNGGYNFLSESVTDSPTITTSGNSIDGTDTIYQTGDQSYSFNSYINGDSDEPTLNYLYSQGSGVNSYTITGTDNSDSGESDRTQTGTDSYTLAEDAQVNYATTFGPATGETVSDLTGTDTYTATTDQNSQTGDFTQTTTGGGGYTLTSQNTEYSTNTTTTTGSTDFTDTETGSTRTGAVTLSLGGTNRYQAAGIFNPNDNGAFSAGVADYSPVGLPVLVTRTITPAGTFTDLGDARYKYCFAAGTKVLMADGSTKAIEKIEVGEMVLAAPEHDPESTPTGCRVLETYHNPPARLHEVKIPSLLDPLQFESIFTTADHPFYVKDQGWTKARHLRVGNKLRTADGKWATVKGVADSNRVQAVYNLHVDSSCTYYVKASADTAAILVHNQSVPPEDLDNDDNEPLDSNGNVYNIFDFAGDVSSAIGDGLDDIDDDIYGFFNPPGPSPDNTDPVPVMSEAEQEAQWKAFEAKYNPPPAPEKPWIDDPALGTGPTYRAQEMSLAPTDPAVEPSAGSDEWRMPAITPPDISAGNVPPAADGTAGTRAGADNTPRSTLPRAQNGNYLPDPAAEGSPHTTLGTRMGSDGEPYTQGATFDENGEFEGRTDVTDHGRDDHSDPHFHPATSPNSVDSAEPISE